MERSEVAFGSGGSTCRAWRYRPADVGGDAGAGQPCVVMAHGFGATRENELVQLAAVQQADDAGRRTAPAARRDRPRR